MSCAPIGWVPYSASCRTRSVATGLIRAYEFITEKGATYYNAFTDHTDSFPPVLKVFGICIQEHKALADAVAREISLVGQPQNKSKSLKEPRDKATNKYVINQYSREIAAAQTTLRGLVNAPGGGGAVGEDGGYQALAPISIVFPTI